MTTDAGVGRGRRRLRRIALLWLCLGVGGAVGWAVAAWTGSAWGYVAIPLVLAVGWFAVADPTQWRSDGLPPR